MLTHIQIKNFVIVDHLELEFEKGFSVLTGETGAGKSIWIDAVALALGNRADSSVIREGEQRCDISVSFDINNTPPAIKWLQENEFDNNDECIIRRVIYRDRATRCSINGTPCPLSQVRELAKLLVNIHGQHQHQALLQRDEQQLRLDQFANIQSELIQTQSFYLQWKQIQQQIELLTAKSANKDDELALLYYQRDELDNLALKDNEWHELHQQHQRLHNAKQLISELNQTLQLTTDDEQYSASQLLQQAVSHLEVVCQQDTQLKPTLELLNTAAIHLQEASDELTEYRRHLDLSPEQLATIEQRLTTIHDLARKHHVNPEQLGDVNKSLQQKIEQLEHIDIELQALQKKSAKLDEQYQAVAKKITKARKKAAQQFNTEISAQMQTLGMQGGEFAIQLETLPTAIYANGNERVTYLVTTNPGQSPQPLSKVVSGGELSRISLSIQVLTAQQNNAQTLIFDEVDTGIGGKTAAIVGQLLRKLGEHTQILCITHLPQVASQGHQHYKVSKQKSKNSTSNKIDLLTRQQRIDELARMLGGSKVTAQAKANAESMLV